MKSGIKNKKLVKGLKRNDKVMIISGKDKGKTGKILKIFAEKQKLVVEGLNLYKRHIKPRRQGEKGQIIQMPMPLYLSKVLLVCPKCGKATRRAFEFLENGKKIRVCKKCKAEI